MMNDFMNVWSMLWLSGSDKNAKDVTLLNIDGIRKGKVYDDTINQYFRY